MSFDLNNLGILLFHSLNLCVQFGLILFRKMLVEQCGLKNIGIKRQVFLAHGTEEFFTEPSHHGTQVIDHLLHLLLLCAELVYDTGHLCQFRLECQELILLRQ